MRGNDEDESRRRISRAGFAAQEGHLRKDLSSECSSDCEDFLEY